MAADKRYKEILQLLAPGDEAVVEEVVSKRFNEGKRAAEKREWLLDKLWTSGSILFVLVALGSSCWGGSMAGGACNTYAEAEAARVNECYEQCLPFASRDKTDYITTARGSTETQYTCECAVNKNLWREIPLEVE